MGNNQILLGPIRYRLDCNLGPVQFTLLRFQDWHHIQKIFSNFIPHKIADGRVAAPKQVSSTQSRSLQKGLEMHVMRPGTRILVSPLAMFSSTSPPNCITTSHKKRFRGPPIYYYP